MVCGCCGFKDSESKSPVYDISHNGVTDDQTTSVTPSQIGGPGAGNHPNRQSQSQSQSPPRPNPYNRASQNLPMAGGRTMSKGSAGSKSSQIKDLVKEMSDERLQNKIKEIINVQTNNDIVTNSPGPGPDNTPGQVNNNINNTAISKLQQQQINRSPQNVQILPDIGEGQPEVVPSLDPALLQQSNDPNSNDKAASSNPQKPPGPQYPTEVISPKRKDSTGSRSLLVTRRDKSMDKTARVDVLQKVSLFAAICGPDLIEAAQQLERYECKSGQAVIRQGEQGSEFFIVESGELAAEIALPVEQGGGTREVAQYSHGDSFGERALLRNEPRAASVYARSDCVLLKMRQAIFHKMIRDRDMKEGLIRGAKIFETLQEDQVAKLASLLNRVEYKKNDKIINQGEVGEHFYILQSGEAHASIMMGDGKEQIVFTYESGALFGEKALLEKAPRGASVCVTSENGAIVYELSREDFEANLGPLSQLKAEQYLSDPRKLISDFYLPGNSQGPLGSLKARGILASGETSSEAKFGKNNVSKWFSVYRPCSRDSIAKMLGRVGVGKGLDVKGKSAKKNRLSGFVPFLQISQQEHKYDLEPNDPTGRFHVYFRTPEARLKGRGALERCLDGMKKKGEIVGDDVTIPDLDEFSKKTSDGPRVWGLNCPEPVFRELFIRQSDISPLVGWETGRASEPEFMNLNLHAVREGPKKLPSVCLYQYDLSDALNPWGLLIAYAEKHVKPVVSDFDTFTMGSTAPMKYELLNQEQQALVMWCLKRAENVLMTKQEFVDEYYRKVKKELELQAADDDLNLNTQRNSQLRQATVNRNSSNQDQQNNIGTENTAANAEGVEYGGKSIEIHVNSSKKEALENQNSILHKKSNADSNTTGSVVTQSRVKQLPGQERSRAGSTLGWAMAQQKKSTIISNTGSTMLNVKGPFSPSSQSNQVDANGKLIRGSQVQNSHTTSNSAAAYAAALSEGMERNSTSRPNIRLNKNLIQKGLVTGGGQQAALSSFLNDISSSSKEVGDVLKEFAPIAEPVGGDSSGQQQGTEQYQQGLNDTSNTAANQDNSNNNNGQIMMTLDHNNEMVPVPPPKFPWMSRWLEVLKQANEEGFHPTIPPYGFGDASSVKIITDVVKELTDCGAVRHGAECFNFYFPQVRLELDDEFLVVWDGFNDVPWRSYSEPDLREWLLARTREGYSYPLNPVWPIRDDGWYKVFCAQRDCPQNKVGNSTFECWCPPEIQFAIENIAHKLGISDNHENQMNETSGIDSQIQKTLSQIQNHDNTTDTKKKSEHISDHERLLRKKASQTGEIKPSSDDMPITHQDVAQTMKLESAVVQNSVTMDSSGVMHGGAEVAGQNATETAEPEAPGQNATETAEAIGTAEPNKEE